MDCCYVHQQIRHRLKAVVSHVGQSAQSGHYVAAVHQTTHWLLCDDEKVKLHYADVDQ